MYRLTNIDATVKGCTACETLTSRVVDEWTRNLIHDLSAHGVPVNRLRDVLRLALEANNP